MKLLDRIEDKWLFAGMAAAFAVCVLCIGAALYLGLNP